MTRDEAVTLLQARLKRVGDTGLATSIITEMQFVQAQLLEGSPVLPWFLLNDSITTLATTLGVETVTLPATFLREVEDDGLRVQDAQGTWHDIHKDDLPAIRNAHPEPETGRPVLYYLGNTQLFLRPIPDAIYTLRYRAYLRDTALSTNIENNWLKYAADLVIAETGIIMASRYLRDAEAAQVMLQDVAIARGRLTIADEARKHASRNYNMGDD